jgi:hypothetical protein
MCVGAATILQPWTLRLILNAAALAAASLACCFYLLFLLLQYLLQNCSRGVKVAWSKRLLVLVGPWRDLFQFELWLRFRIVSKVSS